MLQHALETDKDKQEPWPEYEFCAKLVLDKCVPRLLEPLQANGRSIKPCLVHGNLWDLTASTDLATGEPFIFNANALYAHNEYEVRESVVVSKGGEMLNRHAVGKLEESEAQA